MKIYHNPRCSKSRQSLQLLEEAKQDIEVVKYLDTPPTKEELEDILKKLGMKPSEIIRKGEAIYKENYKGKDLTEEEWIDVLLEHPKLIERPIIVHGDKAVIGRPPEKVKELF
ncbi:arsenate reductase (glutaredoxin) [Algivirga pacifica]|uniref:Arsenate reductase (Glutaredoxin) n=1 Tax=Algivirga pacifica TaxID=1162670 RepID=A0ABP9D5Y2_9BACT